MKKTTIATTYDNISQNYTDLVKTDPVKKFIQYPSALRLLGDISQKSILDVGCGSGIFDRDMASRGAIVTGYDVSPEQIANAKKATQDNSPNINYFVSDPRELKADEKFDKAVSVLVLHYALDRDHLKQFFSSTYKALKDKGEFICILANPQFKRLEKILYNRRFVKLPNAKMRVDFFDKNQTISCSAEYSDFSVDDYEKSAISGGFKRIEWKNLKVERGGLIEMGREYWSGIEEDCPYIGFVSYKN